MSHINIYWSDKSTSEIFKIHGHELLAATAGRDPNYSSKFSSSCSAFHREGNTWTLEKHQTFFQEGLFQYYFAKMISFRNAKLNSFSLDMKVKSLLGKRTGGDGLSHFDKNIYSLLYRWCHRDPIHNPRDRLLRNECRTHLSEQADPSQKWPLLSSASAISQLVRQDEILSNLGALFQKCKALEEHGDFVQCREILQLPVDNNVDYASHDWDFNVGFAQLQQKICFRISQYLDQFDLVITEKEPKSIADLFEALKEHDWNPLTEMTLPEFETAFNEDATN